eukprot:gene14135-30100_t
MESIRIDGNYRKYWGLINFSSPQNQSVEQLTQLMRGEVDCKEEQSRWLSIAALPEDIASGEVQSRQEESGRWTKVAPSSTDGKTLKVFFKNTHMDEAKLQAIRTELKSVKALFASLERDQIVLEERIAVADRSQRSL